MNDRTSAQGMAANRLQLGGFVLDLLVGELLTDDGRLAGLRKQALDVLLVLGRRSGQVVGKDELMGAVWPSVVVGEGSLTQAIATSAVRSATPTTDWCATWRGAATC